MSDHPHGPVEVSDASRQAGHEVSDADAAPLVKVAVGIAVLMVVAFVGMLVLYRTLDYVQPLYSGGDEPHPLAETRSVYEGPRLQPDPPRQKFELAEYEQQVLTTYEWVDQEAGIARIPIDRAIEVLAETGLPETAPPAAPEAPATPAN